MSKDNRDLLVGLDIGTSKVVALVAELSPEGQFNVLGLGQTSSKGLKKGVVVNIEATVQSIQKALEEAELMSDRRIIQVFTGIAGNHIVSFNSSGMVAIRDKEVGAGDVERVLETAKAINIPTDQQILHILIQEFIIDGQEDVREPIGMSGLRLEVKVHIVTGAVSAAQNIVKCVRRCGLEVNDLILQPLASSLAVLTEDEKELGVVLIDIGGGTTDIAMALRTPTIEAEDLKIHHGVARQELADATAMIDVPGVGDREPRPMSKQALAAVIEPRVEELFTLVRNIVRESGYEDMVSSGIVLTGGTAMMPGMEELAEHVFLKPARIGSPEYRGHLHEVLRSPRYSTGLGLLMEGQAQLMRGRRSLQSGSFQGVVSRMKEWFTGNF